MARPLTTASSGRMRFPDISPRAYEHPVDRGALATLRMVPGFAEVLKVVTGFFHERGEHLMALSSAVRVGPTQYPELHEIRTDCADTLGLDPLPDLYVTREAEPNAMTIGMETPFVVLTTGLVELLDVDSLRFVVGHEFGHVLSGHAVYRTMLLRLLDLRSTLSWTPMSAFGLRAVIGALNEWFRKSELSCDRAGLLCGQDPAAALRTHVLMAGGIDPARVDLEAFLRQADEYDSVESVRDSIAKLRNVELLSHPLAVVRAAQLQKWAASGEYRAILAGDYPRRDAEAPHRGWAEDVKSAARSYRESFASSADPLTKVFSDVGEAVSGAAGSLWSKLAPRGSTDGDDRR
ncbi:M48 family metallopeptidase [Saccharomonospora cyanea]|uniref:Zn-dependent protease with chaperone function n=1 Tax=Saccharomonospora cyanea NA-134 TaxID=882082 RepID=H5XNY8_9PSEU|nr:M48 family metallopeptidase [Saccharomonospora cyanea]EHR63237.1 Zn-dependent protease with chaperone function [Saccharomonospora cyanea NA-134]